MDVPKARGRSVVHMIRPVMRVNRCETDDGRWTCLIIAIGSTSGLFLDSDTGRLWGMGLSGWICKDVDGIDCSVGLVLLSESCTARVVVMDASMSGELVGTGKTLLACWKDARKRPLAGVGAYVASLGWVRKSKLVGE